MSDRPERSLTVAYVLWLLGFVGLCGLHRFYIGRPLSGLVWLLTGGLFFVGQFVDAVMLPRMSDDYHDGARIW